MNHTETTNDPFTEIRIEDGSHKKPASNQRCRLLMLIGGLVATGLIVTLLLGCYWAHMRISDLSSQIADKLDQHSNVRYAVVIDAGSMGSRVIAYKFYKSFVDGRLILDDELFSSTKPGLSNFHSDPKKAAASIEKLVLKANAFVPQAERATTPLVLKATAGLRLLKGAEADNLLNAVRGVFHKSGYMISGNAVEIMDGTDEGIFSWFAINYLLGRLNGSSDTVAAMELGGASTQVTFELDDKTPTISNDHIHTISTPDIKIDVFTNSYLNLGLQAVRHIIFTTEDDHGDGKYISSCMNPAIQSLQFRYGTNTYDVSGKDNAMSTADKPVIDFDACYRFIKQKALPLVNPKPIALNQNQIVATTYFFRRAFETDLIDRFVGGETTLQDFMDKAKDVCSTVDTAEPFMCFDLIYIITLLQDGYDLQPTTKLIMYQKIDNHELSWTLGCAHALLGNIERHKKFL